MTIPSTAAACVECGGCLADAAPSAAAAWAAAAGATSAAAAFASLRETTLRARLMRLAGGTASLTSAGGSSPPECASGTFFPAIPQATAAAGVPPTPVPDADIGTVAFSPCGHLAHWTCAAFIESLCGAINPNMAPTCPACGAAINDVVCVLAEFASGDASDGAPTSPQFPPAVRASVTETVEGTAGDARDFTGASWPLRLAALQGHVASVQQRQAAARATVVDLQHTCALALFNLENTRRSAQLRAPRMVALPVQATAAATSGGAGAGGSGTGIAPDVDTVAQRLFRRVVDSAPDPALPLGAAGGASSVAELRATIVNALESERQERQRILDLGATLSTTRGAVRDAVKRATALQIKLRRLQKEERVAARAAASTASTVAQVAPTNAAFSLHVQTPLPPPAPGSGAAAFVNAVMNSGAYQPMDHPHGSTTRIGAPSLFSSRPTATTSLGGGTNAATPWSVRPAPLHSRPSTTAATGIDDDDDIIVVSSSVPGASSSSRRTRERDEVVVVGGGIGPRARAGRRSIAVDVDVDASSAGASDDDILVLSDNDQVDDGGCDAGSRRPRQEDVRAMGSTNHATTQSAPPAPAPYPGIAPISLGSGSGSGIFGRLSPNDVYALPLPTTVQTDIRNSRRVA